MFSLFRPWLVWVAAPIVLILGTFAGIRSVNSEQRYAIPTPRPTGEAAAPARLPPFVVIGQVIRFDLPARAIVVERRDGKIVNITVRAITIVKLGGTRVLPREIRIGDILTAVGRPVANQGVDALLITIRPRTTQPTPLPRATPTPK